MSTNTILGNNIFFTSRSDDLNIHLKTGPGRTLIADRMKIERFLIDESITYVSQIADFPTAVAGIITLLADNLYIITKSLDLLGSRIVASENSCIYGTSSEISFLTSTGLALGVPLISSEFTFNLRDITIHDIDTAFLFEAAAINTHVMDWKAVNIIDVTNIGIFKDYSNFIFETGTILRSSGLIFQGTLNTIGFSNSLFSNDTNGITFLFNSDCVILRRIKIVESSFVTTGTGTSININALATIPNEGLILTSLNFSGGTTTHIVGVTATENKSLFFKCLGIPNSKSVGQIHYSSTVSTSLTINTWTKLTSITDSSSINSKFTTLVNNRLLYTGSITNIFMVTYHVSYTGTNANVISSGVSKNGADPIDDSWSISTMSAAGRVETSGSTFFIEMSTDNYIELWVRNTSASNAVSAIQLTLMAWAQT